MGDSSVDWWLMLIRVPKSAGIVVFYSILDLITGESGALNKDVTI